MSRVSSPYVVRMWEHFLDEGSGERCLVVERPDRALHKVIYARNVMQESEIVQVAADLARGLRELHALGIVVTEIRPRSLAFYGRACKISDLSHAKIVGEPLERKVILLFVSIQLFLHSSHLL